MLFGFSLRFYCILVHTIIVFKLLMFYIVFFFIVYSLTNLFVLANIYLGKLGKDYSLYGHQYFGAI